MRVVVDASDTMVALGESAVWSFELRVWGECTQAATESDAVNLFAARVGLSLQEIEVSERITGPEAVFAEDLRPANDAQIDRTLTILAGQRRATLALLASAPGSLLDVEDPTARQPVWMTWRTPRQIIRHIVDTESRAYPRWCGLPQLEPVDDLEEELVRSARHIRDVIESMPRTFTTTHRGEAWTPVKLLRRLAWHERVESVFLRRRLRAST